MLQWIFWSNMWSAHSNVRLRINHFPSLPTHISYPRPINHIKKNCDKKRRNHAGKETTSLVLFSRFFFSFSYFTAFLLFLTFSDLVFNCSIKRSNILHIIFLKAPPIMKLASAFSWLSAMKDIYSVHYTVTYITLKKPCVWSF
jgi:hypothetical protein